MAPRNARRALASLAVAVPLGLAGAAALAGDGAPAGSEQAIAEKLQDEDAAVEASVRAASERLRPSIVEVEEIGAMPEKVETPAKDDQGSGGSAEGVIAKKGFKQAFGPSTGVAVAKDLVVTSTFAVKREPRHIFVTRHDGKAFVATPLGRDEGRMILLLRVEGADLTPAPVAARDAIKVGRYAISLGRGLGTQEPALSLGIVSAVDRIGGRAIQTSGKVSPANYGGPLATIDGEVMGVLVPLTAFGGMAGVDLYDSGIGFAVPLQDVKELLPRLEKGEKLKPGFLGVAVDQARTEDGVLVEGVQPGSAAEKAGIKAKDVIVEIDGKPVQAYFQLHHALGRGLAGDKVKLVVERNGKKKTLEVTLGEVPEQPPPGTPPRMPPPPGPGPGPGPGPNPPDQPKDDPQ